MERIHSIKFSQTDLAPSSPACGTNAIVHGHRGAGWCTWIFLGSSPDVLVSNVCFEGGVDSHIHHPDESGTPTRMNRTSSLMVLEAQISVVFKFFFETCAQQIGQWSQVFWASPTVSCTGLMVQLTLAQWFKWTAAQSARLSFFAPWVLYFPEVFPRLVNTWGKHECSLDGWLDWLNGGPTGD